jgi:glycosyltransferase involved in cell wall biosynthesis
MACGTPVIAHRRGSMPELVNEGVTGYLVDGAEDTVTAIAIAGSLDRPTIRRATIERFDRSTMIERYVEVYRSLLSP